MTVDVLEKHYLTPRYWLVRNVVPTLFLFAGLLLIYGLMAQRMGGFKEVAVLTGFFAFYFLAVRAGHIYMIRTMHIQLKKDFIAIYPERLKTLPFKMNMRQIGAELAKIKAELHRRIK